MKNKIRQESRKMRESFGKSPDSSPSDQDDGDYEPEENEESEDSFVDNRESDEMTPYESNSEELDVEQEIRKQEEQILLLKKMRASQKKKRMSSSPSNKRSKVDKKLPPKKRKLSTPKPVEKLPENEVEGEVEDEMHVDEDEEQQPKNEPIINPVLCGGSKRVVNLTPEKVYKLSPIRIKLNSAWSVFTDVLIIPKTPVQGPFDVLCLERVGVKPGTKTFRMNIPLRHLDSLYAAVTLFEKQIIAKKTIRPSLEQIKKMTPKNNVIDLRDLEAEHLRDICKTMNVENGQAKSMDDAEFQSEYQFGFEGSHFIVRLEEIIFKSGGGGTAAYEALTIARYSLKPFKNGKNEFTCSVPATLIPYLKGALEYFINEGQA